MGARRPEFKVPPSAGRSSVRFSSHMPRSCDDPGGTSDTCHVASFGAGFSITLVNLLAERRDSAKTSRTRQASCSNWPKSVHSVFAGNVSVPVCKSTLAGSKRISRKGAKTQSVDSLNSFPSSFAPWRLCARPSSSQRPSIRIDAAVSFLPLHLIIGYWELNIGC